MSAINSAVTIVGGQTELAQKLSEQGKRVTQQQVWNWVKCGRAPTKYIRRIALLTQGKVSVSELLKAHETSD